MTLSAFIAAVFLLLLTPGPTNTLLALAGGSAGFRRSLPLIGAEAGGYLLAITPLVTFAAPYLAAHPLAASVIKLCSALWVLLLATNLWRLPLTAMPASAVTFRQVFVTTVLNPKALIFGLVLIPHGSLAAVLSWLGLFLAIVMTTACLWLGFGALLIRRATGTFPFVLRRVAATILMFFSASLAASSLGLM